MCSQLLVSGGSILHKERILLKPGIQCGLHVAKNSMCSELSD